MHAMYAGQTLDEVQSIGSEDLRHWMVKRLTSYGMKFTKDAVEHAYGPQCFVCLILVILLLLLLTWYISLK